MATKKTPGKTASTPVAETAETATVASARVKGPTLRIKDLVDRVAEATGGKKKGVKEMVEATLTVLGESLSKGEDLNLPGFGRSRVARSIEKDGGSLMTLKVRRGPHKKKDSAEPLAEDEVDG